MDIYPDWGNQTVTCVEIKAGDATFHNGLLAHAAGPNMTPAIRRALSMIFMPGVSTYNGDRNVLPKRLFETLRPGDALDDADFNPVAYDKTNS